MEISYQKLEERIAYSFKDRSLLIRSLTHPSYSQQYSSKEGHNQRLEFLGDAVLGMCLADILFHNLPDHREGLMTRYRSMLVNGRQLAHISEEINLSKYIRLSDAEEQNGGRSRTSILEDAFEALIGAIYLDGGYGAAKMSISHIYGDLMNRLDDSIESHNPKGQLQELLQPKLGNTAIEYTVVEESGPDHDKQFKVEVKIEAKSWGAGIGASKKQAEESAARQALLKAEEFLAEDS